MFSMDQNDIDNLRQQSIHSVQESRTWKDSGKPINRRTTSLSSSIPHSRSEVSWQNMRKQSLPHSLLKPYIREAMDIAEEQLQRTPPSIRKISLVQQPLDLDNAQSRKQTSLIFTLGGLKLNEESQEEREGGPSCSQSRPDNLISSTFGLNEDQLEEPADSESLTLPVDAPQVPNNLQSIMSQGSSSFSSGEKSLEEGGSQESLEMRIAQKQNFWDYFTMVASLIYAVGFSLFGLVFYLSDVFITRETNFSGANHFNIYLCIVGIAWLVWLIYDIHNYTKAMQKFTHNQSNFDFQLVEGPDGELMISIPITSEEDRLPEYYCFSSGRHSGSFFLKVGAAAFCLGHLVFIGLNIGKQIAYFASNDNDCQNVEGLVFTCLLPAYVFLQLYIIFKYSNVIVNRSKAVARFALMHCIMSSLCFWMAAILGETMDSVVDKKFFHSNMDCSDDAYSPRLVECFSADYNQSYCTRKTSFSFEPDINCLLARMCVCASVNAIAQNIFTLGPYLYPFSIEFSILVVAIWYVMWSNIGKVAENKLHVAFLPSSTSNRQLTMLEKPPNEAMVVYADCHSSMKGLFLGLVSIALAIIGMIVFFILSGSCDTQQTAVLVNDAFKSALLGIMIVVSVLAYHKISGLEVNPHPISFLDDLLLFICLPSYFLYFSFKVLPGLHFNSPDLVVNLVMNVLVTPMIMDGLRRCSDSAHNQDNKPGRNLIIFLLVSNLAIYFWETMEVKNGTYQGDWKEFYGTNLWTLISHMLLPLCIFYRFHSAVALADIWSSAYKPGDHH